MGALMAALPKYHEFTRWWLRRTRPEGALAPTKVYIYDRASDTLVGEPLRWPSEFDVAAAQLRSLRARDGEVIDRYIFADGFGDT
jgi:hypothetical protein